MGMEEDAINKRAIEQADDLERPITNKDIDKDIEKRLKEMMRE